MKIWIPILSLVLLFFSKCFSFEAEVVPIPSRDYLQIIYNEITKAQSSIQIYMYQFSLTPSHKESQTMKLAQALVDAKHRGVRVEVVLDQNVDFVALPTKNAKMVTGKNWDAYQFLKANDIPVYFDTPNIYAHSKVIIVDSETTILGSTNWSPTSLSRNMEANALIRSKEFAGLILKELSQIEKQDVLNGKPLTVSIPLSFMTNAPLVGEMTQDHDHGAFNLYTTLLKMRQEKDSDELEIDYGELAKTLGISGFGRIGYRRRLSKDLKRLENKYHLIHFERKFGKNGTVKLKENDEGEEYVQVPLDYWMLGWNRKLQFPGKVLYMMSLYYSTVSPIKPRWSISGKELEELLHVSGYFISTGVMELRRLNLMEVQYDHLTKEVNEPRRPNIYTPNSLYDPAELEKRLEELKNRYGSNKFSRALKNAQLVFEECDWEAIERFIHLEEKFGIEKMEKAYKIIELKNVDNPKRSAGYFFNTIINLD